ncbi:hypothetical protein EN833_30105 [Mesorhizobium sp. M4B.F.Ca.ET.190.01.1.1]|uniref:hypothetical protein n=1 Tax=unclassified Mesorhizobium TaxID=325217 RepID=UPI000FE8701E|nr:MULTISPECIES: hypothetical protein [unclassified Mesorhizobium]RWA61239.1 MAG: hypothetical protein EOQ27_18235 [Mesorhizobium sp.]RWF60944.1 MAG: hypothetical protein EOS47_30275 [Mesorhizobium sp.]TGR01275.1 hypothetical protein EN843_30100 [Mesorhizobium sp. M4B.F.Ca.ET.200.01.1.1]TGS13091.1 hypothetical protein EN833_30105 [Mesorhizobium sp. M4B.F.Ca.ET.190.01.1.1]TGT25470.1 hypothetical protein EN815_30085 [Mesorhizobium sp. M4B.F.Ca.ET.172.01.1.1]
MRIRLASVIFCGLLCPSLAAETNFNALYIPPKGGMPPKVLNFETGAFSAVLGKFEARPADCPPAAYWLLSKDESLVSCGDGSAYRLVPPAAVYSGYEDALKLEKITGGGTDDGGPSAPKEPTK